MEEKLQPEIEKYEGQTEEQITMLLDDEVEIVEQKQYDDPEDEGSLINPETQEPAQTEEEATQAMQLYTALGVKPVIEFAQLYDIKIRKVKAKQCLAFKVLPPERCKVGKDTTSFTLDGANYFEYWDETTISDLRKDGFDVEDDISDDSTADTQEDFSRDERLETTRDMDSTDPSMRQVQVRHIWIRFDYDEDGIAELQYVVRVGNTILKREEVSRIPVSSIVPFIATHRHQGYSVTDLTFDIQRIKTKILRSGLDSLELALNPGHVISKKVTIDDMLTSRAGRIVRLKEGAIPGEGHVMPLTTEFVFPAAQAGLAHMDTVTESRVGVSKQFQGIDSGANNDYNRIGQLSTMASQRIELIARIFGNGIERLFSLAHELIIKSGHQAESIKLRGKWIEFDPKQWRTGRDMRVVAPFSAGNKDSLLQRLLLISTIHEKALAGGLKIVDQEDAYNLALEIASAADVPGDRLFTDPATVEDEPEKPDPTMIALEIEGQKVENQAKNDQLDAEASKYSTDTDAQIKKYQTDVQAQTAIALAQIKAGDQVNLETVKANLRDIPINTTNNAVTELSGMVTEMNQVFTESIQTLTKALEAVDDKVDAERELIRDEQGRPIGSRRKQ